MIAGGLYNATDKELVDDRLRVREYLYDFNNSRPSELTFRKEFLIKILGSAGVNSYIEPPFHCDYGYNISVGDNFYSNFNLTVLDCALVTIGKNVLIGPNVGIFTASHPLHHINRNEGHEYALPISIGDNVWIGGNVVINPGVTIGSNSVIGSGSVVTADIPSNVVAVGNPCRVLRDITDEDKVAANR